MRIKNQAILLNMYKKDGLYEKTIDGYRIQLVSHNDKKGLYKKPCLIFMISRGLSLLEQQKIKNIVTYKKAIIKVISMDVENDTICLKTRINNRNIDIIMSQMFNIVQKFIELNLLPPDETTYNKYKFSFGDHDMSGRIFADV